MQFVQDHRELIAAITGSPPENEKQTIWRIAGKGWAGTPEGWPNLIQTVDSLAAALTPHLEKLGEIVATERIDEYKRLFG